MLPVNTFLFPENGFTLIWNLLSIKLMHRLKREPVIQNVFHYLRDQGKMFKKLLLPVFLFSLILQSGCREKLNLTDPGQGTNILISNNNSVPVTLYLTTPRSGEVLQKGEQLRINWVVSPSIKSISLTLFRKNELITGISTSTENDGIFNWKIPVTIPSSSNYRIKLVNVSDQEEFAYSEYFTITAFADSTR